MREQIIKEAQKWLGTKFQHQARVQKNTQCEGGCDCIGLVVGVAKELGLKSKNGKNLANFDRQNYGRRPNSFELKDVLDEHLVAKSKIEPGDVLLMKFENFPQHVGIASAYDAENLGVIHAHEQVGKVVEHRLTHAWQRKIIEIYKFMES